ncbi:MAG: hypothetical protein M1404_01385 [Acidobacteria bacterium]|nr:hypothetical protein [Acidobacteriota bacterium]
MPWSIPFGISGSEPSATRSYPLTGTWQCVAHGGENGNVPFTLHIQQSAESITGWVTAEQGSTDLTSVSLTDNHVKIEIDTEEDQYKLTAAFKDGHLNGTWEQNGQEKGAWEGKKTSSSETNE